MKITAVDHKKSTRYQVEVDGEYWYILDIEIIADHHLKPGMEVDEEFLDEVRRAADLRKGRERALYLLGCRDHCRSELVEKLCRSVGREAAEQAADQMEELGFLNDKAYAEKLADYLINVKKRGGRRVLLEMMQKGLSRQDAEEAIDGVSSEEDLLVRLVREKYARYLTDEKGRNKVLGALRRLGHGYYDSLDAVETVMEELSEQEEQE